MIMYIMLIIPLITAAALYFFFNRTMVWFEYLILIVFSVLLIVLTKSIVEHLRTSDTEVWGEYITQVVYYEPWNEYIHQTCTRSYTVGKQTYTETYDCSYVDYHPEHYAAVSNLSNDYDISNATYVYYRRLWNNNNFKPMHRHYYTINGDAYFSAWRNNLANIYPYFTSHTFENRVRVSNSIFKDMDVDTTVYKNLPVYPEEKDNYAAAYVYGKEFRGQDVQWANKELMGYNALLGSSKQIRMIVVLLKNKLFDYSDAIRKSWANGKKNELIVCVDVDDSMHINWADIISWTDSEALKVYLRNDILDLKHLCYTCLNSIIVADVNKYWQRKHFRDFAYLSVEPTQAQLIFSFILVAVFNVILGIAFVKRDLNERPFGEE